jgi:hypothetical protein
VAIARFKDLCLDAGDPARLGATIVEPRHGTRTWTVMADPEAGEFCAFLRPELPAERLHGLASPPATSAGMCWPTRKETSSARSPSDGTGESRLVSF